MAEIVTEGQRAVPERALAGGFTYQHADLDEALRDTLALDADHALHPHQLAVLRTGDQEPALLVGAPGARGCRCRRPAPPPRPRAPLPTPRTHRTTSPHPPPLRCSGATYIDNNSASSGRSGHTLTIAIPTHAPLGVEHERPLLPPHDRRLEPTPSRTPPAAPPPAQASTQTHQDPRAAPPTATPSPSQHHPSQPLQLAHPHRQDTARERRRDRHAAARLPPAETGKRRRCRDRRRIGTPTAGSSGRVRRGRARGRADRSRFDDRVYRAARPRRPPPTRRAGASGARSSPRRGGASGPRASRAWAARSAR